MTCDVGGFTVGMGRGTGGAGRTDSAPRGNPLPRPVVRAARDGRRPFRLAVAHAMLPAHADATMFGYFNQRHLSIRGDGSLREDIAPDAFDREASRWQSACSRLMGVDDRWTARAVARHLRRHHPDGIAGTLADDLADKVRDVVRWRRWAGAAGVALPGFDGGRLGDSLATADRLARAWALTRPDYGEVPEVCRGKVEATRSSWVVRRGSFRLGTTYFSSDVVWRGATRGEARAHVADERAHEEWRMGWIRDAVVGRRTFPAGEPDMDVVVWKPAGGLLKAVLREGGAEVGSYRLGLAAYVASRAMGGPCLSGERIMDPYYRGRGFGDAMHSAVEAVAGHPLVPHGVNGNTGGLTALSTRYYAKRVARGEEGAFSREVADRFSELSLHDGEAAWLAASHDTHADARAVVAMRRMVGGTLRTMRSTSGEALLDRVWLSMPGGMAMTVTGRRPEADVVDSLDDEFPGAAMSVLTARDMRRLVGQRMLSGQDRGRDRIAAVVATRTLYDAGLVDTPPALDPATAIGNRQRTRDEVVAMAAALASAPRP